MMFSSSARMFCFIVLALEIVPAETCGNDSATLLVIAYEHVATWVTNASKSAMFKPGTLAKAATAA